MGLSFNEQTESAESMRLFHWKQKWNMKRLGTGGEKNSGNGGQVVTTCFSKISPEILCWAGAAARVLHATVQWDVQWPAKLVSSASRVHSSGCCLGLLLLFFSVKIIPGKNRGGLTVIWPLAGINHVPPAVVAAAAAAVTASVTVTPDFGGWPSDCRNLQSLVPTRLNHIEALLDHSIFGFGAPQCRLCQHIPIGQHHDRIRSTNRFARLQHLQWWVHVASHFQIFRNADGYLAPWTFQSIFLLWPLNESTVTNFGLTFHADSKYCLSVTRFGEFLPFNIVWPFLGG